MKFMKKLTLVTLVLMTLMTAIFPTSAMAASKTYKGSSSASYTITTGKKGATLTLKPVKGTRAQKYVKRDNARKTKIDKWSAYASYSVKVDGKTYTVTNKNVKVTLSPNTTYTVSITCKGVDPYNIRPDYNPFSYKKSGAQYWYKDPSIKVDVNNFAKVR